MQRHMELSISLHHNIGKTSTDFIKIVIDDAVKRPISALRFVPLSLRRTRRTPQDTGFMF
jgi:hypothetical protein